MQAKVLQKAVDAPGAGRYRGKPCAIKGCGCLRLAATTDYCALHFQQLVGRPRLKEWLKVARASTRGGS
jgi:hypothetical protein